MVPIKARFYAMLVPEQIEKLDNPIRIKNNTWKTTMIF
jgi:hypothetical protein